MALRCKSPLIHREFMERSRRLRLSIARVIAEIPPIAPTGHVNSRQAESDQS
jgi:hypothetical protein